MLDVRRLVLLREVSVRGSIAAAAEALNYTRSAVSQQLTALEAETGVPLLDRGSRRAELTAAGRLLVEHCERVLSQLEAAESDLKAAAGQVAGELRVGVAFHEGPALLAPVMTAARDRYPGLRITLHHVSAGDGRQAVHLGRLDLVIASRYDQVPEPALPDLHEEALTSDSVRLAVATDHPLADGSDHKLAEFADDPWILNPESALGALALHAAAEAGFAPDIVADTDNMHAVLGLVSLGWGVALVPDLVPDRPGLPIARVALDGVTLTRHLSLVARNSTLSCPSIATVLPMIRARAAEPARGADDDVDAPPATGTGGYLYPMTTDTGPSSGSAVQSRKPASASQPRQSAPL